MPALPGILLSWTGQTRLGPWWRFRLGRGTWCCYVHDAPGAEILLSGGEVLAMGAGEAVLLPPWSPAMGRCHGQPRQAWAVFATPGIGGDAIAHLAPQVVARDLDFTAWSAGLPYETSGDLPRALERCAWLARIVAGLLPQAGGPALHPDVLAARRRIAPALAAITAAPGQPHTVDGLAQRCGISSDHLARCFRRALDRSPLAWLREQRVQTAAELLLTGDTPIAELASACGFVDRYHFTRVFSHHMGMGPAAYRDRMRAGG